MENRVVCFYCGTIYEAEEEKCPLCGGKTLAKEEARQPVQRRRITEQERRQRRRASKGGKFAAPTAAQKNPDAGPTKKMLVAALIFLALSVVAVTWFIGDMIGWWGGLEDTVDREQANVSVNTGNNELYISFSEEKIHFEKVGDTFELKVKVNSGLNEKFEMTWSDAAIAEAEEILETIVDGDYKMKSYRITAVAEGVTELQARLGEYTAICKIVVGEELPEMDDVMTISPEKIRLEKIGDTTTLELTVNADFMDKVEVTFPDISIVEAVQQGETTTDGTVKKDVWQLTAVSEGTTKMEFKSGDHYLSCEIVVGEDTTPETNEPITPPEGYEPELNRTEDISFYEKGETFPLNIVDLPEGATVIWRSADETVAKVDDNGLVTAVGGGETTVSAEVFGETVEVLVRCPFDESGDIGAHLKYEDVTIAVGEVFYLYLLDSNNERITDVTYEVSKEGVCTVDDGKVVGVTAGSRTTVTIIYNTERYECIVRVRK